MKSILSKSLTVLLVFSLVLTPRLVQLVCAQDTQDAASDDEILTIQQLAKTGYLGDKKDFYLSAKSLTDDDVTDALIKIYGSIILVDLKVFPAANNPYRIQDLQTLLKLVEDKADDIRDRKVSAWKFENRLKKMIALLSPAAPSAASSAVSPTPTLVVPTPTATPIPGPNRAEWNDMKDTIKDLTKKAGDLQDTYDKKIDGIQKSNDDLKAANLDIKAANADIQEQLKLMKRLLDRVQDDLKQTDERLETVSQKAQEKSITDTELQQELTILHKDLRDNTEDVSVLKQEMVRLDKASNTSGQSPLDEFLNSKWLPGGALVVGLAALVVGLTRK